MTFSFEPISYPTIAKMRGSVILISKGASLSKISLKPPSIYSLNFLFKTYPSLDLITECEQEAFLRLMKSSQP